MTPGGEVFVFAFVAAWGVSVFWGGVISAAIIGTAIGLATYSLGVAISGERWRFGGALKAMFWGGVSGAVTFGIGSVYSSATSVYMQVGRALMHGFSQSVLAAMQGTASLSTFLSGFGGSIGASGWSSVMGNNGASMIAFGAISGGVGAELAGGNFWQGAVIGGIVAGLNHSLHSISQKGDLKSWYRKAGVDPKDIPNMSTEAVKALIAKVPELGQLYDESGRFKIGVNPNDTRDLTIAKRGERIGTMTFGTDAFKSNLSLGISIIHETGHALDIYSGNIYKFDRIKDKALRDAVIEYRMYDYELKYAPSSYNRSGLNYLNNYGSFIYQNYGYDPNQFLKW